MLHVYDRRWLLAMLACVLALSLLAACTIEESGPTPTPEKSPQVAPIPVDEVSLEEAEEIVGITVAPKYLPTGYEFQRGFVRYHGSPPRTDLSLYFSDEEITEEVKTLQDFGSLTYKIVLNVNQIEETPPPEVYEEMAKQYGGKVVDIDGDKGWLASGPVSNQLIWVRQPGLLFDLSAIKELSGEELMKIAESIG
jgi:hypothetical protein